VKQPVRKYDGTIARIAGNLLSGKVGKGPEDQADVLYVQNAVRIARLIVAEIERTEPTTPEEP